MLFEHGLLLAQGGILEGDLFLAAENGRNETNRNHNCIQLATQSAVICTKNQEVEMRERFGEPQAPKTIFLSSLQNYNLNSTLHWSFHARR
jgi:hypothetical protein